MFAAGKGYEKIVQAWLPDGYIKMFRLYVFGPLAQLAQKRTI